MVDVCESSIEVFNASVNTLFVDLPTRRNDSQGRLTFHISIPENFDRKDLGVRSLCYSSVPRSPENAAVVR